MGVNENYLFGSFNRILCVDILGEIVYNLKVIVNLKFSLLLSLAVKIYNLRYFDLMKRYCFVSWKRNSNPPIESSQVEPLFNHYKSL